MSPAPWIGFVAFLASFAGSVLSAVTENGAVRWVWQMQRTTFGLGLDSVKPLFVLLISGIVTWGSYALAKRLAPAAASAGPARTGWGPFVAVAVLLAATVWALGIGLYRWSVQSYLEDSSAIYVPIDLARGDAPQPSGRHIALSGMLLDEHVLEHQTVRRRSNSRSTNYYLVPIASPQWRAGEPVRYIVRIGRLEDLRVAGEGSATTLLGLLSGTVPEDAAKAFTGSGVPLGDGAQLVQWVPSRGGSPVLPDTREENWRFALAGSALISGVMVFLALVTGWSTRRKQRRLSALA